jgi:esterase/lipase
MAYYEAFDYFTPAAVRDGCHPRLIEHADRAEKSVVLIHGLSDSPYYLAAIADYFSSTLKFNVYLPLLQCHGLVDPRGMADVQLEEWKRNVGFAIGCAAAKATEVSVGGLSTGGTLGLHSAVADTRVNGALYLFSAALDLAGGVGGLVGELKERLLRTRLASYLDRDEPLIGPNPFRYTHVDIDGAKQLSRLIKETDALTKTFSVKRPFRKRVFAAHSEADTTANIRGIERLQRRTMVDRFVLFRIAKERDVSHASVVLRDPVYAIGAGPEDDPLERVNPMFNTMMESLTSVASSPPVR